MNNFRVDIYTRIHKELRAKLFELSNRIGACDVNNNDARKAVTEKARALFHELREHARHENTYAHPIITSSLPQDRLSFEHEHAA